ncbi:hypothetical protein, partial [Bacteroides heparinolyticus]|uniref:hypothetical protein n=1 Tax=Prevotella heparinolytica TaxID=28113 RepID=UPI0035A0152A
MRRTLIFLIFLFVTASIFAQNTVSGMFPKLSGLTIRLVGFSGFDSYHIDSCNINEEGRFDLCFDNTDCGMAYLSLGDNHPLVVVLAENEKLILKG